MGGIEGDFCGCVNESDGGLSRSGRQTIKSGGDSRRRRDESGVNNNDLAGSVTLTLSILILTISSPKLKTKTVDDSQRCDGPELFQSRVVAPLR